MKVTSEGDSYTFTHEHGAARGDLLPNASSCIFMSGFFVDHLWQRQGLGDKYHKERLSYLKERGHIQDAYCLVVKGNVAEERIMEKNGWDVVMQGVSGYMTMYHRKIR